MLLRRKLILVKDWFLQRHQERKLYRILATWRSAEVSNFSSSSNYRYFSEFFLEVFPPFFQKIIPSFFRALQRYLANIASSASNKERKQTKRKRRTGKAADTMWYNCYSSCLIWLHFFWWFSSLFYFCCCCCCWWVVRKRFAICSRDRVTSEMWRYD